MAASWPSARARSSGVSIPQPERVFRATTRRLTSSGLNPGGWPAPAGTFRGLQAVPYEVFAIVSVKFDEFRASTLANTARRMVPGLLLTGADFPV
jgi:hypothetical protein